LRVIIQPSVWNLFLYFKSILGILHAFVNAIERRYRVDNQET
jgi:hypothetical protein